MSENVIGWMFCPEVVLTRRFCFNKLKSAPDNGKIEEIVKELISSGQITFGKYRLSEDVISLIKKKTKCSYKQMTEYIEKSEDPEIFFYKGDHDGFYEDDKDSIVAKTTLQKLPIKENSNEPMTVWDMVIELKMSAHVSCRMGKANPEGAIVERFTKGDGLTVPDIFSCNNCNYGNGIDTSDVKSITVLFEA